MGRRPRSQQEIWRSGQIGKRMRASRELRGLSQADLARRIGGLSPSAIYKYESGGATSPERTIRKIAVALGVREAYLKDGTGPQFPKREQARQAKRYRAELLLGLADTLGRFQQDIMSDPGLSDALRDGALSAAAHILRLASRQGVSERALSKLLLGIADAIWLVEDPRLQGALDKEAWRLGPVRARRVRRRAAEIYREAQGGPVAEAGEIGPRSIGRALAAIQDRIRRARSPQELDELEEASKEIGRKIESYKEALYDDTAPRSGPKGGKARAS